MNLQKIFVWSKKVHRLCMWVVIGLGAPQAITGILIGGDSGWRQEIFSFDQLFWFRLIHRQISSIFALFLAIMMITGFVMWVVPELLKRKKKKEIREGQENRRK